MNYKYQIFGSKDSQDIDIMVFVDELKSIDENHTLIKELNDHFSSLYSKEINCNLAVLENGMIKEVFKGTEDECNNSLFYTYENHDQKYPNVVTSLYDRSRGSKYHHIKLIRVARFILSFFSREPELRTKIKPALRGDLLLRLEVLKEIDFTKYTTFPGKKEKHEDIYKVLAFQFAQVMGLSLFNKEVYTKSDAKELFNKSLSNMLNRKPITIEDLNTLNECLRWFIIMCETEIITKRLTNFNEL